MAETADGEQCEKEKKLLTIITIIVHYLTIGDTIMARRNEEEAMHLNHVDVEVDKTYNDFLSIS